MADPVDWIGPPPWEWIRDQYQEHCPDGFRMQLVAETADVVAKAIDQGIDPRLEAITFLDGPAWRDTHRLGFQKLCLTLDLPGLLVLLRRLSEMDDDEADRLREDILSIFDYEEDL